jgi:hypothetical protein
MRVLIIFIAFLTILGCAQQPVDEEPVEPLPNVSEAEEEPEIIQEGCAYGNLSCLQDEDCISNTCVLKEGCLYDNPPCPNRYECINNSCILRQGCEYDNPPCEENHTCLDNECVLKQGCEYGNPPCGSSYDCIENACVLKEGCEYGNPSCGWSYDCIDNKCVLKTGCTYNNPPCGSSYDCISNACVLKKGCKYNNPPCGSGYECKGNECVSECDIPSSIYSFDESIGGEEYIVYSASGSDVRIACQKPCPMSNSFLEKKFTGLKKSVEDMEDIVGHDLPSEKTPMYFHYTSDSVCGDFEDFETGTGFATTDPKGRATACMFDYEKDNILVPFTEETACSKTSHLLSVHEAGHHLLGFDSYWPEEYFVKMLSFHVSGHFSGNDPSDESNFEFGMSACDDTMQSFAELPYYLCTMYGIDVDDYDDIFPELDRLYSLLEFKDVVDDIAGEDTEDAFEAADLELS